MSVLASRTRLGTGLRFESTVAALANQLDDVRDGNRLVAVLLEVCGERARSLGCPPPAFGLALEDVDDLGIDGSVLLLGPTAELVVQVCGQVPDIERGHVHDASTLQAHQS